MKKISVIVPCYNEEEVIEECYKRIDETLKTHSDYENEIIFINDGSLDNTLNLLQKIVKLNKNVIVISFARNFGHQAAVTAGIKQSTGDATIIIDADMQDPPELIWDMVNLWEKGNDVVYGKRKKREGEKFFKIVSAKAFYKTLNKLSDVPIPEDVGDFRLVDKKIIENIKVLPEKNKFLRGLFSWQGFKQIEYEYDRKKRTSGNTKYSLKSMLKLAKNGIIGFSKKPLAFIGILSLIILTISILLIVISLIIITVKYSLIMLLIMFVGINMNFIGLVILCIYINSLYIENIFDNVQNRPDYIIEKILK